MFTSRQRLLSAFHGQPVDRVPVTLFIQDQGHFITQVYPHDDPHDWLTLQRHVIEFQRQMGVDIFVRLVFGTLDPLCILMGALNTAVQTDTWEVRMDVRESADQRRELATVHTPAGTLTQEISTQEIRPGTFVYAVTRHAIHTPADLEIAARYEPGLPAGWAEGVRAKIDPIRACLGDDGIIGAWAPAGGPFNMAAQLMKSELLYGLFLTEPEFYARLMEFVLRRAAPALRAIDAAGVDVHIIGGNVPGGFVGRRSYEKYILPYEARLVTIAQENGKPAIYHNCGQIMNLVESYRLLGAKVVEPFSPPPLGDADLARAKQLAGDAYAITSGVDQVNLLQKGTIAQVEQATAAVMRIGKPGGGFTAQNVDFLEYGTPIENVEAFVRVALENAGD